MFLYMNHKTGNVPSEMGKNIDKRSSATNNFSPSPIPYPQQGSQFGLSRIQDANAPLLGFAEARVEQL